MALLATALVACVFAPQLASAAQSGDTPLILRTHRLSMDSALTIARGAIDHCRKAGYQVAVTVVDDSGDAQVVLRDSLAPELALRISRQKAYTALSFQAPSGDLAQRFDSDTGVAKVSGLLLAAGGVPVTAAGATLAAVGVSGAPSGKRDAECANAGIQSIQMDLEMSDIR